MNSFIGKLHVFASGSPRKEISRRDQYLTATPILLIIEHFRQCGFIFALRESLKVIFCQNITAHLKVAQSLALPQTSDLKKHHPRIVFKYFGNYLAHSFSTGVRSAILANHYRYLNSRVTGDFMNRICEGGISLWETSTGTSQYQITLAYPSSGHKEGELSLLLWEGSLLVFTLSFTIAPGVLLNVPEDQVVYVGRLQGAKAGRQVIRRVAKSLQEIAPPALLLVAAQAVAAALKIPAIVGVNAHEQVCVGGASPENNATLVYDDFWRSAGAARLSGGMFYLRVAAEEKPLNAIKSNHRSRVRRKRQFKNAVMEQVGLAFREYCLGQAGDHSSLRPAEQGTSMPAGELDMLAASLA